MNRFGFLILLFLVALSCRKEGCMDINSASYDSSAKVNDGMCTYRYLRTVTVRSMDEWQDTYTPWDGEDASGPDLQFSIVKQYEQEVPYPDLLKEIKYDVEHFPVTWDIPILGSNEYLQTEMTYSFKLVEVDREGEVTISQGNFCPRDDYADGKIKLTQSAWNVVIELNYIEF